MPEYVSIGGNWKNKPSVQAEQAKKASEQPKVVEVKQPEAPKAEVVTPKPNKKRVPKKKGK